MSTRSESSLHHGIPSMLSDVDRRSSEHPLVAFYTGQGRDVHGRLLKDVWSFSFDELEDIHDYIQWLFPLFEPSRANPSAPRLNEASAARFRRDPQIRRHMRRSFELMLRFYGLAIDSRGGAPHICRAPEFAERAAIWLTPRNHNFLRITRILRCLSIVHAAALGQPFLRCLEDIAAEYAQVVSEDTLEFWRAAVPLA